MVRASTAGGERVSVPTDPKARQQRLLDDHLAEVTAVRDFVAGLSEEEWLTPTPAEGWDIRDSVAHLAMSDDVAFDYATTGRSEMTEKGMQAIFDGQEAFDAFERDMLGVGRGMTKAEILDWWDTSNARMRDVLAAKAPDDRIQWGPNKMSTVSLLTARLMETWTHGVDCFDAMGAEPPYTERLRHVAFLGLRALPYAFSRFGVDAPGAVRLELTSPSGEPWTFGPEDAPTVISGTAVDWCRVATHRDRGKEKQRLDAKGPDAEDVLRYVQAYL